MAKPPPRLFLSDTLDEGYGLPLEGPRWHYLHNVLRMGEGDKILLFNGQNGEWAATITGAERRRGALTIEAQTREPASLPELALLFAPVKKDPVELIIQKGTELGVTVFQPVITARTILSKGGLRLDRLEAIAIEAAEQCERLDVPLIEEPMMLEAVLRDYDADGPFIFCDEAGDDPGGRWGGADGRGASMLDALEEQVAPGPAIVMIGPEGGFTPEERAMLREREWVIPVSLGPRILKAETAAIAALTLWQAARGDWR